jgi:nitrate/nitrite transport system ATP-binding protein
VPLPRPRNRLALAEDPQYHHCRAAILRFLHEPHAPAVAA